MRIDIVSVTKENRKLRDLVKAMNIAFNTKQGSIK